MLCAVYQWLSKYWFNSCPRHYRRRVYSALTESLVWTDCRCYWWRQVVSKTCGLCLEAALNRPRIRESPHCEKLKRRPELKAVLVDVWESLRYLPLNCFFGGSFCHLLLSAYMQICCTGIFYVQKTGMLTRPGVSRPRPEVSRPRPRPGPRPEIKAKVEFNSYGL